MNHIVMLSMLLVAGCQMATERTMKDAGPGLQVQD